MKTIALCVNLPEFNQKNAFHNPSVLAKYPGCKFVPFLDDYGWKENVNVLPGAEVVHLIMSRQVDPASVHVICEEKNYFGEQLVSAGCHPMAVYCLESPLYTKFYSQIEESKSIWKNQILFGSLGTHSAYFPSFDEEQEYSVNDWPSRTKDLCLIMSNKFLGSKDPNELQTLRYQAVEYFSQKGLLDLFGAGWKQGSEIPYGDKNAVMNQYRYAICFENYVMPGYVTEKIIDCFVSGTIPLWRGTDDVHDLIPSDCFWDVKYRSLPDIESIIRTDYEVNRFASHGREFLTSEKGKRFSYQSFARTLLDMLL